MDVSHYRSLEARIIPIRVFGFLHSRKGTKRNFGSALCLCAFMLLPALASTPQADIEKGIDALMARMTLEEKLGQLQQLDGDANGEYRPRSAMGPNSRGRW